MNGWWSEKWMLSRPSLCTSFGMIWVPHFNRCTTRYSEIRQIFKGLKNKNKINKIPHYPPLIHVRIKGGKKAKNKGPNPGLNRRPLTPKARILPLNYQATDCWKWFLIIIYIYIKLVRLHCICSHFISKTNPEFGKPY